MNLKELRERIAGQAFTLQKAKTRGFMVNQETERMRNTLMNSVDEIIEALEYAEKAEERITRLTIEVESADAELQEKDDEIAALKKKPAGKRAKASSADVEQSLQ